MLSHSQVVCATADGSTGSRFSSPVVSEKATRYPLFFKFREWGANSFSIVFLYRNGYSLTRNNFFSKLSKLTLKSRLGPFCPSAEDAEISSLMIIECDLFHDLIKSLDRNSLVFIQVIRKGIPER